MTHKHSRKTPKKKKYLIIALSIISALILAVYLGFGIRYQSHYLPGTKAYGVEIGNLNQKEAAKKLKADLEGAVFVLKDKDQKLASVTGNKLGIQQNFGPFLSEKMSSQNPWIFKQGTVVQGSKETDDAAFDTKAVRSFVTGLFPKVNEGRKETKNAYIANDNGKFKVVPEVLGTNFNEKDLQTVVENEVQAGKKSIQLSEHYVKPDVTKDSEKLKKLLAELDKLSNVSGTYTFAGKVVNIPAATITSWLGANGDQVAFDQAKMQTFIANLNKEYSTYGSVRQFKSTKRGVVAVGGGIYGWSINPTAEIPKLIDTIKQGKNFTREPDIQGSGYHKDGTDIGSSYVEVDKLNQHMYVYQNGKEVLSTDIVTGKPGQDTPVGVFNVWSKARNSVLRGFNDDGTRYASPVDYWMPIDNTGVGLHDSPWQPKYGGDWWVLHGSHGCVNTPPAVMAKLFALVPVGTPVIVI